MSYLDPPDYEEEPLIKEVCPHCKAVDINWGENLKQHDPNYDIYQDTHEPLDLYECPICHKDTYLQDLEYIYSDDFCDRIVEHLPPNWVVTTTNEDWKKITIGDQKITEDGHIEMLEEHDITIPVQNGQIDWIYPQRFINELPKT